MTDDLILNLNEENFDAEIARDANPILVDFWASWCRPCTQIAPVLEELAAHWHGRARVAKVDVDSSGDLANRFEIRSIPTLLVFRDGKVLEHVVGAAPRERIRELVEKHLG